MMQVASGKPKGNSACCFTDGSCTVVQLDDCTGTWQGEGTDCVPNLCPQPGACCYEDGSCDVLQENACIITGGTFDGSATCFAADCPQPPGACCIGEGICEITIAYDCADSFYQGLTCADVNCKSL